MRSALLGLVLVACGVTMDGDDAPTDTVDAAPVGNAPCPPEVIWASPNFGHNGMHALYVTAEDIASGVGRDYDIKAAADHSHIVTVYGSDFALIANGGEARFQSTQGGSNEYPSHIHTVYVRCRRVTTVDK
jgi:hypothetical protein